MNRFPQRFETRMAWGAVRAGAALSIPGVAIGASIRGWAGALAVLAAVGIVVLNLVISAAALMLASRARASLFPSIAMPSYALRMLGVIVATTSVLSTGAVDTTIFAVAFVVGLVGTLAYECYLWAKTPWLAMTLKELA